MFELLELLRDQIWDLYALDIQAALRAQTCSGNDPRQLRLSIDPDPPF